MTQNKLSWWQWSLIGIGGLLVLLGIPYLLNHFILQPQRFTIVGEGKDWLLFWSAWLGAIASFAMVFITWRTLRQNQRVIDQNDTTLTQNQELIDITKESVSQNKLLIKLNQILFEQNQEQLDELKRQWEEQNRARLQFSIIAKETLYLLKISNAGKSAAFGINLNHNELLLDHIDEDLKRYYPTSAFALEVGKSQYLPICVRSENDKKAFVKKCGELHLKGSYCNSYTIDEMIITSEYMQFEVDPNYDAEMIEIIGFDKIKECLIKNNRPTQPSIQKSLDIIANKIKETDTDNDTK